MMRSPKVVPDPAPEPEPALELEPPGATSSYRAGSNLRIASTTRACSSRSRARSAFHAVASAGCGTSGQFEADAKGTVPIPTINIGFRWNFNDRWRILLLQELFGLKIGDFSGKRENTRLLTEVDIIRNFGVGGGFERHNFEVEAEGENFVGQLDSGYSAFTLYLKAQW